MTTLHIQSTKSSDITSLHLKISPVRFSSATFANITRVWGLIQTSTPWKIYYSIKTPSGRCFGLEQEPPFLACDSRQKYFRGGRLVYFVLGASRVERIHRLKNNSHSTKRFLGTSISEPVIQNTVTEFVRACRDTTWWKLRVSWRVCISSAKRRVIDENRPSTSRDDHATGRSQLMLLWRAFRIRSAARHLHRNCCTVVAAVHSISSPGSCARDTRQRLLIAPRFLLLLCAKHAQ